MLTSCGSTQVSPGCTFGLTASQRELPAAGNTSGTASVVSSSTSEGCSWEVHSDASWLSLSGTLSGTRQASFTYTASPNPAATPRTATLILQSSGGGSPQATVTITQSGSSPLVVGADAQSEIPAGGGNFSFSVRSAVLPSATSDAQWLVILGVAPASGGSEDSTVNYHADSNGTGQPRIAHVSLTDGASTVVHTVTQRAAGSVVVAVEPSVTTVPATGGAFSVSVTSGGSWTAKSDSTWIRITSALSGSGNGTVSYSVDPNTGITRTGGITISTSTAMVVHSVNQSGRCDIILSPSSQTVAASGGTGALNITTTSDCSEWSATVDGAPWITIESAATGSGSGAITYSVAANPGGQRSGRILVSADSVTAAFTITQASQDCSLALSPPPPVPLPATAGTDSLRVTSTCSSWTASVPDATASWLTLMTTSGSGNGTIAFTVAQNPGSARMTRIRVTAGSSVQEFTVSQASGIVTPFLVVSSTAATPPGVDCLLDPSGSSSYIVRCLFNAAGTEPPNPVIAGYLLELLVAPSDARALGSGGFVINPTIGCVTSVPTNTPTSLPVRLTITVQPGFPPPAPLIRMLTFFRTGGC
ncbi:MAG TPA: BACON domain-containing protein [Vicinamibacterales bacterium]|nr:BACON domain-containing protein [Vicinamibacterales bacterium]